jgi:hypothetical protein
MINKNNKKGNTMTKNDKKRLKEKVIYDLTKDVENVRTQDDIEKVKIINKILYNITDLLYYTSKKTIGEAIEACRNDKDARESILKTFDADFEVIEELYRVNIITDDLATMLYEIEQK